MVQQRNRSYSSYVNYILTLSKKGHRLGARIVCINIILIDIYLHLVWHNLNVLYLKYIVLCVCVCSSTWLCMYPYIQFYMTYTIFLLAGK